MDAKKHLAQALEIRSFARGRKIFCIHDAEGKHWNVAEPEAIAGLQESRCTFHVFLDGGKVPVIVAADRAGNKFLATRVNGEITDDLLAIPDYPSDDIHSS
jgi:hypothetical protein